MLSRGATQPYAPAPALQDDIISASTNSVRGARVDSPDVDMDFEFISAERQEQLTTSPTVLKEDISRRDSGFENIPKHASGSNAVGVAGSQDQPHSANHNEQARIGRVCQSFDEAPARRPIKAHLRRRSRHGAYIAPYRHSDHYTPGHATYFDRDAHRPQRSYHSPARQTDISSLVR